MSALGRFLRSFGLVLILVGELVGQQFSYENTSILTVIEDIEEKTTYRFLYREALIADILVTFQAEEENIFDQFALAISANQLGVKIDENRNQALIYKSSETVQQNKVSISGFIIDDETGERLPFATLSWREYGYLRGVTSNSNGQFSLSLTTTESEITILATYVGYENLQISFDLAETSVWKDVSIRLNPKPFSGKEIIVQGINFYTPNDTVLNGLMKIGTFSPLGESNAVRSLQMLPAVSMNAAVNDGINIRGSSSDGFQVLLDGQTVYNQSHLFGLLDAMNADVLKSSGFYYDITPAQFQAPLGGTLSLITRTGSINDVRGSVGLSNTAIKSTLEGPILKGKSSWLISGRLSYLDEIDWFNNSKMIEYGLDVNRPVDLFADPRLQNRFVRDVSLNTIDVQNTDASFYDLHGKVYFEGKNGSQFIVSGYLGSDEASQDYLRDDNNFQSFNTTSNKWDNGSITAQVFTQLGSISSSTNVGFTAYSSNYTKDDFVFPASRNANGNVVDSVIIQPLSLDNEINQFDLRQSFSFQIDGGNMEVGISYSDFDVQYLELGLTRESFLSRRTSQLVDFFQQIDLSTSDEGNLSLGSRVHYFSNGRYLRWSPRIKYSYSLSDDISFGAGFSRNYQFINRLEFYNINSNDFWILTNEDQPPSSVNYYTTGLYYNLNPSTYFQIEGYYKHFNNLRLHELNTGLASVSFRNNEVPWYYQNEGRSRGFETLIKNRFSDLTLTTAYTFSITELKNEVRDNGRFILNDGEYFYASWDRRHQFSAATEVDLKGGFNLMFSWIYGTGIPSRDNFIDPEMRNGRLPDYSRVDITLNFKTQINTGSLDASFSVYNAFDRDNTWYSERKQVTVTTINDEIRGTALTHVYDLGIQPSFSLKYNF